MAGLSFNFKIKAIDKKKYTRAAALGAFSTTLFMTLALSAPLIADIDSLGVWFIFAGALMMAVGNVLALLILRPLENFIESKKKDKPEEEVSE